MALTACKECNKELSDTAKTCPHCGAKHRPKTTTLTKVVAVPIVGIFLFFIYALFASQSPENQAMYRDSDVIKLCWKEQEKKSFDPELANFIAGTCKNLEQKFRIKYMKNP